MKLALEGAYGMSSEDGQCSRRRSQEPRRSGSVPAIVVVNSDKAVVEAVESTPGAVGLSGRVFDHRRHCSRLADRKQTPVGGQIPSAWKLTPRPRLAVGSTSVLPGCPEGAAAALALAGVQGGSVPLEQHEKT